jgi:phosphoenolpyruvate---glycerone phosphotransferase subunit DhaK
MKMKKFMNRPEKAVEELLEGFVLSHPGKVCLLGDRLVARAQPKIMGRVALVTLGGSGHEPALSGFVGAGLLDISVPGEVFAAPGAPRCLQALRLADRGRGVLLIVLNHAGDVLQAKITMDMAESERFPVRMVTTRDDIAGGADRDARRGLVGFLPVYKVAGAAAEEGRSLEACVEVAERMERNTRTLAVAVRTATHPSTGEPIFELGDEEMEIGMGQHGEAGTGRMPLKSADETADLMLQALLADLGVQSGEELLVIVNGAGATTLMELFILFRRVHRRLAEKGIRLIRSAVGEFVTTQEQAGFQLMISRMDRELTALWDAPCDAPYFTVR